jgi:hypothetical protein
MVSALQRQVRLLKAFSLEAFGNKNNDYIPEVASKLRVLVSDAGSNHPLLLDLMDEFGINIPFDEDLMHVPAEADHVMDIDNQGARQLAWMKGSSEISRFDLPLPVVNTDLRNYLDSFSHLIGRVPFVEPVTKIELIRAVAEQSGGAHEDPGFAEHLAHALDPQIQRDGQPPFIEVLRRVSTRVVWVAEEFLRRLQQERPDLFSAPVAPPT